MAIIVVLIALAVPAVNSINGAGSFTGAISTITGTLEQARTYAMANNTYVYVGILEEDASTSPSATPPRGTAGGNGGRVVMAVVASKNGLPGYDLTDPQTTWKNGYNKGTNLTVIGKPTKLDNVHLAVINNPDAITPPTTPDPKKRMQRVTTADVYQLGHLKCVSLTPFAYPPGGPLESGYQYYFDKVIGFDPQGTTRIITQIPDADSNPLQIEIGLLPTHGAASPTPPIDPSTGQQVAIQMDGITSALHIYRP